MNPRIDFWFDFASSYSYPAAMRIDAVAARNNVAVSWRPFLLGPIFASQGWRDSPFNIYPLKGRYMWRDLERICDRQSLPLRRPKNFPQNSLTAARCALALAPSDRAAFVRAVFSAQFAEGLRIDEPAGIAAALAAAGLPERLLASASNDKIKAALRAETEEAQRLQIFGAPSFVTQDGELFWGNDRLEEAIEWALRSRLDVSSA
ncbi:MAG TPA: 2-hydroxychromene-2-carboxylate isomerase [Roseiarcus sp.]|nr:2-hydroxychromene-2-carboxylate isomerase [Roseiarcus sp.]